MSLFHNAPKWTILFLGYSYAQQYTWRAGFSAAPFIALDMTFQEKNFKYDDVQVTHNHLWSRVHNTYLLLYVDQEDDKLSYEEHDLSAVFNA
jgi:hypothetical protein